MGEDLIYNPNEHISRVEYFESKLFQDKQHPERFTGDDLITGKIGDVNISRS